MQAATRPQQLSSQWGRNQTCPLAAGLEMCWADKGVTIAVCLTVSEMHVSGEEQDVLSSVIAHCLLRQRDEGRGKSDKT